MKSLTDDNFKSEIANHIWLVVFWATWCGPCCDVKYLEEFELSKTGVSKSNINIGRVNIEENPNLSISNSIVIVPTYLFFKNGNLIKSLTGLQSCNSLKEVVKNL